MTGNRLRIGFALGAALAGMLAAALRVTGVSDGATAVADEPAAAHPAPATVQAAPPPAPGMTAETSERWRAKPAAPAEVPARVVTRAARAAAPPPAPERACTPAEASAAGAPGGASAGAAEGKAGVAPCGGAPKAKADTVEIDWHAPPQPRP